MCRQHVLGAAADVPDAVTLLRSVSLQHVARSGHLGLGRLNVVHAGRSCLSSSTVSFQASAADLTMACIVCRTREGVSGQQTRGSAPLRARSPTGVAASASIPAPLARDSRATPVSVPDGEPPPLKRLKVTFGSAARGVAAAPDGVTGAPGKTGLLRSQTSACSEVRRRCSDRMFLTQHTVGWRANCRGASNDMRCPQSANVVQGPTGPQPVSNQRSQPSTASCSSRQPSLGAATCTDERGGSAPVSLCRPRSPLRDPSVALSARHKIGSPQLLD